MNIKSLGMGISAAALAAMPLLGVNAATNTQTDTVSVNVVAACSMTVSGSNVGQAGDLQPGSKKEDIVGSTMNISCNNAAGWKLTAVGGDGKTASTTMTGTGTPIPTGTAIDGSTSNWAFKVAGSTNVTIGADYTGGTFKAIPGEAKQIAGATKTVSGETVTITYGVSISKLQAAGTYTGKVTYTLAGL